MREELRQKLINRDFLNKCLFWDGQKLISTPDGLYDYEGNLVSEQETPYNFDEIETARKVVCDA